MSFLWVDSQCGKAKLTYKLKRKTTTSSYLVSLLYSHFWVVAKHLNYFCCKYLLVFSSNNCFSLLGLAYCAQDSSGFSSVGSEGQGRCAVKVHLYIHINKQCLWLFPNVCSRFIAVSINISKTAGHHYMLGVVAWPCGGFCIKRFLIEPGKDQCLLFPWTPLQFHSSYPQPQV